MGGGGAGRVGGGQRRKEKEVVVCCIELCRSMSVVCQFGVNKVNIFQGVSLLNVITPVEFTLSLMLGQ